MTSYKPLIIVSVAAIVNDKQQILYTQRPEHKPMAGLWEFPGGKLEVGETAEQALQRELKEELSLQVNTNDLIPLTFASHEYDTFIMLMPLFVCYTWKGPIIPNENQAYAWVNIHDLKSYPMPPADEPILDRIIKFLSASVHLNDDVQKI